MRTKLFLQFFCLAMLLAFTACSDDDEHQDYPFTRLNNLKLKLTEVSSTSTSFTFDVEASDAEVDYLCLYVDKAIIDQIDKADLPAYLMEDLQKQATNKGESFESYLASISYKGNVSGAKINNLLPGRLYELVVFGIQGSKTAQQAEYLFFQTLMADPVDCTFQVEVEPQSRTAKYKVNVSVKDIPFYFCTFPKATYDQMSAQGWSNEAMLMEYMQMQLEQVLGSLMNPGQQQPTQEQIDAALNKLLFVGDVTLNADRLSANTSYVWLAAAFKLVEIEGAQQLVMVSDAAKGDYTTLPLDLMRDFTFDIQVTDIENASARIVVNPSLLDQNFIWAYEPYTDVTKNMTADELMNHHIETNRLFLNWLLTQGKQDIIAKLVPNKKYYVLAYGYDGGVTCLPKVVEFDSPAGGDPSSVTFSAQIVQNTPYLMMAKVIPSDLSIPYIAKLVPASSDFNLTVQKELVEASVAQDYKMQSMFNPGLTMDDYIYKYHEPGIKEIGEYNPVIGQTYMLCAFSLNLEGKVAASWVEEAFATTPELSDVTLTGKVIGYFNGDEEAGSIFGDANMTKGKSIIVMKYTPSSGVVEGKTSLMSDNDELNELDPAAISDKELLTQATWNDLAQHGYSFVTGDWGIALNSFSYGIDKNKCEGKIARLAVAAPDKNKVNPIEELRKLVSSLESARFMPVGSKWSQQKKQEPQKVVTDIPMPWKPTVATQGVKAPTPMLGADLYLPIAHPVK